MKITCERCSAKYSIADEKVAGRAFRIRCKKCSEVIIVRGSSDLSASSPSENMMSGQRNESSVLFSLQNLRALATGASAGGLTSSAGTNRRSAQAGRASAEVSGLVDIRALAAAAHVLRGSDAKIGSAESDDDVLCIGMGSPLAGGLGAPILGPAIEEKRDRSLIIATAAVVGVVALALAAVIGVLAAQPGRVAATPGPTIGTGPISPGEGMTPPPEAPTNPVEEPAAPNIADRATDGPEDADEGLRAAADEAEGPGSPDARGSEAGGARSRDTRGTRRPARTSHDTDADRTPTGPRPLEELLDRAAPMEARSALPNAPSREGVLGALRSVRGSVTSCGNGQHGVANTIITVAGSSGRVANVRVTGSFAGDPVGTCVARAVRGARFPRFRQRTFRVSFPYRI